MSPPPVATEEPRATCLSIAGQSHLRVGKVNQDAAGAWSYDPARPRPPVLAGSAARWPMGDEWMASLVESAQASPGPFTALAVSDGHGSANYDRSDRGSAIAVWLSLHLSAMAAVRLADVTLNRTDWTRLEAPRRLVEQWRRFVLIDAGPIDDNTSTEKTIRRYGATIIGCIISESAFAVWQLGDGEAVVLGPDGSLSQPTPESEQMLGTETRSLCEEGSSSAFRVAMEFGRLAEGCEVILATDGVPNSFPTDEDYASFVREAIGRRESLGVAFYDSMLRWMGRCSSFSGDDASVSMSGPLCGPT